MFYIKKLKHSSTIITDSVDVLKNMDTKALCSGYNDACYQAMRDDACRTEAYRTAISSLCRGKVVVDIGTGS